MENFNFNQLENANITSIENGDIITGKVVKIDQNLIFVDIGYKMEGKIEKTEFNNLPLINDEIEVMVLHQDEINGELILSHQQAKFMKAWKNIMSIYNDTKYISGVIKEKLHNGYLVDIGLDAFLPFSHIRPSENFIDKNLMFKIIEIKPKTNKVIVSRREYIEEVNKKKKKEILEQLEEGQTIEGIVKNITKFGVFVDLGGIDGLIPRSELSWSSSINPDQVVSINQKLKTMVIFFDKAKGKITLSLKALQSNPWNTVNEKYQEEMIAKGKVVNIIPSGVFIELEPGIEGYISKENLTWTKYIKSPHEILKLNDIVEFKILKIDKPNRKIALGLKQILQNPWETVAKKYLVGQKIIGKIKFIVRNGAFISIDDHIEGFIDLHDISWTQKFKSGFDAFKKGDTVHAVITDINSEKQLIKLSLKQLLVNPWEILTEKISAKTPVEAEIDKLTKRGAFVKLENELYGFIPMNHYDLYHSKDHAPSFKKGDKIKCLIIDIDERDKLAICSPKEYKKILSEKEMEKYIKKEDMGGMRLGDMIQFKNPIPKEK